MEERQRPKEEARIKAEKRPPREEEQQGLAKAEKTSKPCEESENSWKKRRSQRRRPERRKRERGEEDKKRESDNQKSEKKQGEPREAL